MNVREKPCEKLGGGGLKLRRQLLIHHDDVVGVDGDNGSGNDDKCDDDDVDVGSGNKLNLFEFRVKQTRVKPSFL